MLFVTNETYEGDASVKTSQNKLNKSTIEENLAIKFEIAVKTSN